LVSIGPCVPTCIVASHRLTVALMARVCLAVLGACVVQSQAVWKPADAVVDLNIVEQALHKVEVAKLTPEQKKMSTRVVSDVEHVVLQLNTDKKLTKAQKMVKAKAAIEELKGLQAQWELAEVEGSLKKITELSHLSTEQRAAAKKVVADVDATVEEVEAGKLTGEARNKQVKLAIKELQDLQHEWLKSATASKVQALQHEIDAKKALLKKDQMELKMVNLEKELAEKKLLLKKLVAEKDQAQDLEKQHKEDNAQEAMVSKLLGMAKALAASRKPHESAPKQAGQKKTGDFAADPTLSALVVQLQAQERNVSASIDRLDAEQKTREAMLAKSVQHPAKDVATDAMKKAEKMMTRLLKEEHRKYLKARAVKEAQRQELIDGIHSIQKGDATALGHLMVKMEKESKSLQAKTKGFLY